MFLKCIEMTGFKSFPEKTIMHMNGSITGVVGPNGSGKSNVADAVRWVLGEQSPKSLRGTIMQDVIFAGTQTRQPRSFCEVSLIFDNSDGRLSSAYSEIQVTRKLFSSGEGEYYLNGTKCRLKDILDLFRDTGVGKEGYSIIGQGRIDEILSEKSLDRRRVFEEASGIMKYRVRKEEAERKLEKTRFNLMRVNDILTEQKYLLDPLKEQAEGAMEYLKLSEKLKRLDVNLFLHDYSLGKQRIEKYKQAKLSAEEERTVKEEQLKELDLLHGYDQESAKQLESEAEELSELLGSGLTEVERVEGEIKLCEERLLNTEKDSSRITAELKENEEKETAICAQEAKNASRQSEIDSEIEILKDDINEAGKELAHLSDKFTDRVKTIEAVHNDKLDTAEKMSDVKSTVSALREKETFLEKQINDNELRLSEIGTQQRENAEAELELKTRMQDADKKSGELRDSYNGKVQQLNKITGQIAEKQKELENTRRELDMRVSSAKMLGEIKGSFEGYQESVRRLMIASRENGGIGAHITGIFAELVSVPQKYEIAVEAVLGAALQNIVVEDEYDAKELIAYLRKNDMGRVTFLPLKALRPRGLSAQEKNSFGSSGVFGAASELVSCEEKVKRAVEFLLGRTVIVQDSDTAIRLMRDNQYSFRAVTLEGDVFNPGGAITGGSMRRDRAGIVSRDRREEELKKQGEELAEKVKGLESSITELKKDHDMLMNEIEGLRRSLNENDISASAVKEKLRAAQALASAVIESIAGINSQRLAFINELETVKAGIRGYETLMENIQQSSETKSEDYKRFENEYNSNAALIEQKRRQMHDAEIKTAELLKEKSALANDNIRLANEKQETLRSRTLRKKTLELNSESAVNLGKLKAELETTHREKLSSAGELRARHEELLKKKSALSATISGGEEKLLKLRMELGEISEKIIRTEFNIEKSEAGIQEAQNKLWDNYRLTYANALSLSEEINVSEATAETEAIREKIRDMGPVNPNAIEEYNELKERMETLTKQKDDLILAEEDLHVLIASLLNEMRKTFKTSFEEINKYFNQTFQELFDGGSARLVLEDEQDIMECGIEIVAEPPGKKLQKISLLSGGEKALTAICLLFALLKINPSPVCILDEIDAALDDANVYKFSEYLQKYARKMQFIVITHKKPTMVICDSLYGFAMEEKGVSKILSVRLEESV